VPQACFLMLPPDFSVAYNEPDPRSVVDCAQGLSAPAALRSTPRLVIDCMLSAKRLIYCFDRNLRFRHSPDHRKTPGSRGAPRTLPPPLRARAAVSKKKISWGRYEENVRSRPACRFRLHGGNLLSHTYRDPKAWQAGNL